ncbi:MAG TPA: ABC transporter substrate-binding protein [Pseudonocardiaceae bacterium]
MRFRVLLVLLALFVAGCASHPAAAPQAPTPRRIVSLDASSTEILYGVGAGSQVVAVDKDSNYPADVPKTHLDATKPNVEAIAGYHPDLVVTAYDTNSVVSSLEKIHVPVLLLPAPKTVDGAYAIWNKIGAATGHAADAQRLVDTAKQRINAIVAGAPHRPLSFYYEVDQTYFTATSHTFIGSLLGRFGMTDIADAADSVAAGGYPQLSAERVLAANPSLIFLADSVCCGQNARSVAARPGWGVLAAVRNGNVVALNDDIASRWGPRIVDLMRTVAGAVTKAS